MHEVPQRELRNEIGRVLRDVAAGESVRITVRGKPVADLVPIREDRGPQRFVPREDLLHAFQGVEIDENSAAELLRDLAGAVEDEPEDPWA